MTYSDLLLFYARKGVLGPLRRSAYRKFCRRNTGKSITAECTTGFAMNTIIGDSVDNQIAVYGCFESGTTRVVERLASECSSFVDIGCNIGYYSCLFGVKNPGKPLLAIDPNPTMIERTEENLKLNGVSNYELLNCGIGDQEGTLTLNIPLHRHSLSSFAYVPSKGGPVTSVEVPIRTLHAVIREHSIQESFVKVDTEGFEYPIFRGLSDEAVEKIRFVLFEMSSSNLRQARHTPAEIFSLPFMTEFDVYLVEDEGGGFVQKIAPHSIGAAADVNANLLLARKGAESERALQQASILHR